MAIATQPRAPLVKQREYTLDELINEAMTEHAEPISQLVIGEQGVGKTSALKTIDVKKYKTLYVNADCRESVLPTEWLRGVDMVKLPLDPANAGDVIARHQSLVRALTETPDKYDVIIYDSTTPLMANLWYHASDMMGDIAPKRKDSKATDAPSRDWNDLDEFDESYMGNEKKYGYVAGVAQEIIFGLRNRANLLFVLIAHEKEPFFQDTGEKAKYTADVRGSLKSQLPKQFKEVYYCVQDSKDSWVWLTQPARTSTGIRFGRTTLDLPKHIPMDYGALIAKWEEKYGVNDGTNGNDTTRSTGTGTET